MNDNAANETISPKQLLRSLKEMRMLSRKAQEREREEIAQWVAYLKQLSKFTSDEIDKAKLRLAAFKADRQQS